MTPQGSSYRTSCTIPSHCGDIQRGGGGGSRESTPTDLGPRENLQGPLKYHVSRGNTSCASLCV